MSPRLAAILLAGGGSRSVALACALLSERPPAATPTVPPTTSSDVWSAIEHEDRLPPHVRRAAAALQSATDVSGPGADNDVALRRALLAGYPDRVGRRRSPESPRVLLASGHGAVVGAESGVRSGEFLLALDVTAGQRGQTSEARIRMASAIDRDWLSPTSSAIEHTFDPSAGIVRAARREYYDAIVLTDHPAQPDPIEAARLLAEAYLSKDLRPADVHILRRLTFAELPADRATLIARAAWGARNIADIQIEKGLDSEVRRQLDRLAPVAIDVPSGRQARLEYEEDGSVTAAVKLQELFGLAETPRVGPRREPVRLSLLAPNGRPVQMTRDLRSFWERTYPEVRKELRGRYPKHPWPEDPWSAPPTARTIGRKGRSGVK